MCKSQYSCFGENWDFLFERQLNFQTNEGIYWICKCVLLKINNMSCLFDSCKGEDSYEHVSSECKYLLLIFQFKNHSFNCNSIYFSYYRVSVIPCHFWLFWMKIQSPFDCQVWYYNVRVMMHSDQAMQCLHAINKWMYEFHWW